MMSVPYDYLLRNGVMNKSVYPQAGIQIGQAVWEDIHLSLRAPLVKELQAILSEVSVRLGDAVREIQ